jgi:hypothetical protein
MAISDDYVTVAERIGIFREKYPQGSLRPANPAKPYDIVEIGDKVFVVVVAAAYRTPDDIAPGIGMAWEPYPAVSQQLRGSELMVCESSAWGRAIVASLAADTKRSVASADEVTNRGGAMSPEKVSTMFPKSKVAPSSVRPPSTGGGAATASPKQVNFLRKLASERGGDASDIATEVLGRTVERVESLTSKEASAVIDSLLNGDGSPAPKPKAQIVSLLSPSDEEPF